MTVQTMVGDAGLGEAVYDRSGPYMEALLLCDHANVTGDGKPNLAGVFNVIFVKPDEPNTPSMYLFLRIGNAPQSGVQLRTVAPSGQIVAQGNIRPQSGQGDLESPGPLEAIIRLRFAVHERGVHWFEVLCDGEVLGRSALTVNDREQDDPEEEEISDAGSE